MTARASSARTREPASLSQNAPSIARILGSWLQSGEWRCHVLSGYRDSTARYWNYSGKVAIAEDLPEARVPIHPTEAKLRGVTPYRLTEVGA
jgi:hypothetical protein